MCGMKKRCENWGCMTWRRLRGSSSNLMEGYRRKRQSSGEFMVTSQKAMGYKLEHGMFIMRVVKHWTTLHSKVVKSPSLEVSALSWETP